MSDDEAPRVGGDPPPAQVRFALTPGQYQSTQMLDYSKTSNLKMFNKATLALEQEFDLKAANMRVFLENLNQRAKMYGWTDILEIPTDVDDDYDEQEYVHLIDEYGSISLEQVRAHANTYVLDAVRAAQDSYMLAMCIMNSLTEGAKATVTLYKKEYMFGDVYSGPCLLKVVIRESHIDTNATIRIIREQLRSLDKYMVMVDSDIIKFNEHVDELLAALHSRGATTEDLLTNLFEAYAAASDQTFVRYIQDKKDKFDDGESDITSKKLMSYAVTKYKTMVECKDWNTPTQEQVEIMALQAKISKLERKSHNSKTNPEGGKNNTDLKKKKKSSKTDKSRPWWRVPPKQGESHTVVRNELTWHWCPKHKKWVRHLPEKCEGKGKILNGAEYSTESQKRKQESSGATKDTDGPKQKRVRMAASLARIMEPDVDDDEPGQPGK